MSYINEFRLFRALAEKKKIDSKSMLADAKRDRVESALKRSKDGLPEAVAFTDEQMEEEYLAKMAPSDKEHLWHLRDRQARSENVVPELLRLRKKHPKIRAIYNYIAVGYSLAKDERKFLEIIEETIRKFPDYIFGKTALAEYYLKHQEHRKIKDLFGGEFELRRLYPDRKIFHISEVRGFFYVVGAYFARANNMARALYYYLALRDIDPNHLSTKLLGDEILIKEIEKLRRKVSKTIETEE